MRGTSKRNRAYQVLTGACLAGGFAAAFPRASTATVIFDDTFNNGSAVYTGGAYPTPTSDSTGYAAASNKTGTATISSGSLALTAPSSSSDMTETQALFVSPSAPVLLQNVGDTIEMTVVFTDTASLNKQSGSQIYFGLYSSAGTNTPDGDLLSSATGLTSTATQDKTGGVQDWLGYVSQIQSAANGSSNSKLYTRPAQSGSNNTDQDLIGNGAAASAAYSYENPTGTTLTAGGIGGKATLTNGDQYTEDLSIVLGAGGVVTVNSNLYAGDDSVASLPSLTPIATNSGTDSTLVGGTSGLASYDGLAIGWRDNTSTSGGTGMAINEITINAPVPEPASMALLGISSLGLLHRRRKRA